MLAVILSVSIHTIACFGGGTFFGLMMSIASEEPYWEGLRGNQKFKAVLSAFSLCFTPAFFTTLLLWYSVHKMV